MKSLCTMTISCLAATLFTIPVVAETLPDRIAARGSLILAVTPNYPPLEFRDPASNALTGFDVDLGEALARKLGVKVDWQETAFEQMIPALGTGRVDAILSGMSDLASRHPAASFVDYLRSGPQFFAQASRAAEFSDMQALCGKSVGASRRTSFPKEIAAWSDAHCGGKPINFVGTEGSADARTQLKQGRIDAAVQGNETLSYVMAQEPSVYATIGEPIGAQLTGIAISKDDAALQNTVAGALDSLIADGTYKALLSKWRLSSNGIEKASINAGQ
ncbi:ABC transporter substrate-binding protein [Methylocapsa sp. S129]|uniref:ABC transporter substrate-binding protein n=1 Tax=Methylocapsa sp. S129 TaxID=1641869 RepID=UPI001AEE0791|nr:ABC transporter substrate-binding protein [Methylocapsa sp. S129]